MPTDSNPADLTTHDADMSTLRDQSMLWKGPDWLSLSPILQKLLFFQYWYLESVAPCNTQISTFKKFSAITPHAFAVPMLSSEKQDAETSYGLVAGSLAEQEITWNFILPLAPPFGCLWESAIKIIYKTPSMCSWFALSYLRKIFLL